MFGDELHLPNPLSGENLKCLANSVNKIFTKLADWGPYKKVGEVSEKGLEFIDSSIGDKSPELFSDYVNRFLDK